MARHFDDLVIGTGQAGPSLASRLSGAGRKVAVVERKRFGGTCVNTGCIPTKTLVASARAAHVARNAGHWGVAVDGTVRVDLARVKARKDEQVRASAEGVEKMLRGLENGTVIEGHARFTGPRTVEVNGETLTAERVFVDVGGRAASPPIPGIDRVEYLTNVSIMELTELPEHLVVVGGSYVGLEFAQMFRRFGSRVTVVEKADRLIPREDPEVSEAILDILRNEDVEVRLGSECIELVAEDGRVGAGLRCDEPEKRALGSHLLLAVGRRPNTDDLGLDAAGVETDERGYIRTDDRLRTTGEGVWALGDCNGKGAFTHTSYNDYEVVAANLLDDEPRRVTDRIPAYALYIDPPLGRAGLTEAQVRESGARALVARLPMSRVGRAKERGETRGFMKALVDADSKRILGAAILGIEADEVIHVILDVMYADAPHTVIGRAMHIHPTVSELLPTLFQKLEPLDQPGGSS